MKRLEEIKNEYAFVNQYPNWDEFISELPVYQREEHYDKITELYAREVAQASLEKAAENANMKVVTLGIEDCSQMTKSFYHKPSATEIILNKSSITNESNITLL